MGVDDVVREYWGRDDLEEVVFAALRRVGVDPDAVRVEDLAGLDQLHAGGVTATEHLLDSLELAAETTLLDVGSGVGGPARHAAARHGCPVTGIDLSPDLVRLSRTLTDRVGLSAQVSFDVGSATELPYADGSFARAMLNHVGMNIADKARVFAEVRRVLQLGGLFAVYEQMRTGDGQFSYPLPWADDERSSFVETRDAYVDLLRAAGFTVRHDEDRLAAVTAAGPPEPGSLTQVDLFGPEFAVRMANNRADALAGLLSPVLIVAAAG